MKKAIKKWLWPVAIALSGTGFAVGLLESLIHQGPGTPYGWLMLMVAGFGTMAGCIIGAFSRAYSR